MTMASGGAARLSIRAPQSYLQERRYALDVVLGERLGLAFDLQPAVEPAVEIRLGGASGGAVVSLPDRLFATPQRDWLTEASMPATPLAAGTLPEAAGAEARAVLSTLPGRLPILYGAGERPGSLWRATEGGLELAVDVFGSAFFLLTRYEEAVRRARDSHGRFPSTASLGAAEGFLEQPLVDQYAALLRAALLELWPGLAMRPATWALRPTHDVDFAWAAYQVPTRAVVRAIARDLVRQKDPGLAARRAAALGAAWTGHVAFDPFDTYDFLMDTSERHGLWSTFYFMTGTGRARLDGTYRLDDPRLLRVLARVHDRGHEVGLHAAYDSYDSAEALRGELDALRAACSRTGFDQPEWGVRQHFLRFEAPATWGAQAAAGLAHDSTVGYADRPGFRAGTSYDYPVFDLESRQVTALRERPLVAMDATLFSYLGLGLADGAARVQTVMDACRPTGGEPVLLYHNSTLTGGRWKDHYRELVAALVGG
jgi:hypothetical protein